MGGVAVGNVAGIGLHVGALQTLLGFGSSSATHGDAGADAGTLLIAGVAVAQVGEVEVTGTEVQITEVVTFLIDGRNNGTGNLCIAADGDACGTTGGEAAEDGSRVLLMPLLALRPPLTPLRLPPSPKLVPALIPMELLQLRLRFCTDSTVRSPPPMVSPQSAYCSRRLSACHSTQAENLKRLSFC